MRSLVGGLLLAALVTPRPVLAHGVLAVVFDPSAELIAEPRSGFVGAGGRLRLGFTEDPRHDALYLESGLGVGLRRGAASAPVYVDGSLGYRTYFDVACSAPCEGTRPWFVSLGFGGGVIVSADTSKALAFFGPVVEVGFRVRPWLDVHAGTRPSIAGSGTSEKVVFALPVTVGVEWTPW